MKKIALLLLVVLSPLAATIRESAVFAATFLKAAGFELKDQYNKAAIYRFPRNKITVRTFGDRQGAEQSVGWVRPRWEKYQDRIDQQGIAVLSGVPRLARGMVRMIFRTQIKYPVLLDWKGAVSRGDGHPGARTQLRPDMRTRGGSSPEDAGFRRSAVRPRDPGAQPVELRFGNFLFPSVPREASRRRLHLLLPCGVARPQGRRGPGAREPSQGRDPE